MRLYFLVPEWIDDPARPSGGNTYDRRVSAELTALGWAVTELHTPEEVDALPDGALLLADGLLACAPGSALVAACNRLRVVVLAHMPYTGCGALLSAAAAVVTTSRWTREHLLTEHRLPPQRIFVAEPGVDRAEPARGSTHGATLLCVGAIQPLKGQDVLLEALAQVADLAWHCSCVGALDRDPEFVASLRDRPVAARVEFTGPRTGPALAEAYAGSDVLVLPSRTEAYGLVVAEALARGLPVIASDVGGVREALGGSATGNRAGILVRSDDPAALATALRRWLTDGEVRADLRRHALDRRATLDSWAETARRVGAGLAGTRTD